MARIVWELNGQVLRDYPFQKGGVTVGRRKDNTIVLSNLEVSGYHVRIDKKGTDYILTDLQSTNGTFVRGRRVLSHKLMHGDRISIGKNQLLFIGTEKTRIEQEKDKAPLNSTVMIGAPILAKRNAAQGPPIEEHIMHHAEKPGQLRTLILSSLLMLIVVGAGYFLSGQRISHLRGIFSDEPQVGRIDTGTGNIAGASDAILDKETSHLSGTENTVPETDPSIHEMRSANATAKKELPLAAPSNGLNLTGNLEPASHDESEFDVEAIIWSSDGSNTYAFVNGAKVKVGESLEGRVVTEIGRDYLILTSPDRDSSTRLNLIFP